MTNKPILSTMNLDNHETETIGMIVRGRVQGVGFRMFVAMTADRLSVSGWVKNLPDGSVQLQATASRPVLDKLTVTVRRGPGGARVTEVETQKLKAPTATSEGFRIL
jgi:acylphosphatase